MREIKFRAWDKRKGGWRGAMWDREQGGWAGGNLRLVLGEGALERTWWDGWITAENDRYILMQFTGLRDKNGKEIYEGDILRQDYTMPGCHPSSHIIQVVWMPESCCFGTIPNHPFNFADLSPSKAADYYVAGNIYENPELLELR